MNLPRAVVSLAIVICLIREEPIQVLDPDVVTIDEHHVDVAGLHKLGHPSEFGQTCFLIPAVDAHTDVVLLFELINVLKGHGEGNTCEVHLDDVLLLLGVVGVLTNSSRIPDLSAWSRIVQLLGPNTPLEAPEIESRY